MLFFYNKFTLFKSIFILAGNDFVREGHNSRYDFKSFFLLMLFTPNTKSSQAYILIYKNYILRS